jgi:hypothetical protein
MECLTQEVKGRAQTVLSNVKDVSGHEQSRTKRAGAKRDKIFEAGSIVVESGVLIKENRSYGACRVTIADRCALKNVRLVRKQP